MVQILKWSRFLSGPEFLKWIVSIFTSGPLEPFPILQGDSGPLRQVDRHKWTTLVGIEREVG